MQQQVIDHSGNEWDCSCICFCIYHIVRTTMYRLFLKSFGHFLDCNDRWMKSSVIYEEHRFHCTGVKDGHNFVIKKQDKPRAMWYHFRKQCLWKIHVIFKVICISIIIRLCVHVYSLQLSLPWCPTFILFMLLYLNHWTRTAKRASHFHIYETFVQPYMSTLHACLHTLHGWGHKSGNLWQDDW